MEFKALAGIALLWGATAVADLTGVPTVPFTETGGHFDISSLHSITVDAAHCEARDTDGSTLIPPTLQEFAQTFSADLKENTGKDVKVRTGDGCGQHDIYVTIGNSSEYVDVAGRWTNEAYTLDVTESGITITGASPLGAWWGTRSVLQQIALNDGKVPAGKGVDAPGWGTRGIMLDCGRHYYPPEFIVELCTWQSYWKENTFHFHLSDNLYNNPNYTYEQQMSLYARFRPWSDDERVAGLNKHRNESYTREDFDYIQSACAARGVTVIPEIESPGHALVISQWKQELGLQDSLDQLNISFPDTIATVETIWDVFLPWFQSKTVEIGADEYSDKSLTNYETGEAYNYFVNTMNDYIRGKGRDMRIWGTFPPQVNYTNNINKDVTIQHWEFFEDNPYWDYIKNGYSVVNSDDRVYLVQKWSGSYPQQLNMTFIFHGNPNGSAWSPNIFDVSNATNNAARDNSLIVGSIAPQWNDYGANTSTYLEAYYAWREGLPAYSDKQWGGKLTESEYDTIYDTLQASAPGQNLDRVVPSKSSTIFHYNPAKNTKQPLKDMSSNAYSGKTNCAASRSSGLQIRNGCSGTTPLSSKGENYTLSFAVRPHSSAPGPILTGSDSALYSGNGSSTAVQLISAGNAFALNYSLPVGEWTEAKLVRSGNRTFFGVNGKQEMEFNTRMGINGEYFVWATMAVNAPLKTVGGGAWEGDLKDIKLVDYAS